MYFSLTFSEHTQKPLRLDSIIAAHHSSSLFYGHFMWCWELNMGTEIESRLNPKYHIFKFVFNLWTMKTEVHGIE